MPVIGAATGGIPELLPEDRVFTAGRIDEFRAVLEGMLSTGELAADARRNFDRAGDFRTSVLTAKRQVFYHEFLAGNGFALSPLAEAGV
jgi:hypothetical protein